jgi:surface antigen
MMNKRSIVCLAVIGLLLTALLGCANTRLNKAQQASVFGALAGGLIGSQLGPPDERNENALIGAGLGFLAGYLVGNEMDKYDRRQVQQTLEYEPTGQTNSWVNPDTGKRFAATPGPAYAEDGRIYRDVELEGTIDGRRETIHAEAYRQDGRWVLVQ